MIQRLLAKLPERFRNDPEVLHLMESSRTTHLDIVHLIYRQDQYELESKDYDFSRATMQKHWQAGLKDMQNTIDHPQWLTMANANDGVTVYDLTGGKSSVKEDTVK